MPRTLLGDTSINNMKSRLSLFALTKLCLLVILLSANLVQSKEKNGFINELQSREIENVRQNLRVVQSRDGDEKMIINPNIMKELVCKSEWFLKLLERNLSQSLLPLSNKDIDNLIGDIVTILCFDSENFHSDTTNEIMKRFEYFGFWSANTKYTPDHKIYDEIWNSFTWRNPKKGFLTSKNALNFITQLHLFLQSSRRSSELKMLMNFFDQPLHFDHSNPRFRSFPPSKTGKFLFISIKLPLRIKSLIPRDMSVVKAVEEAQNMISFDGKKLKYNLRVLNVRTLNLRLINRKCQSFITTIPPITQNIVCGEPLRKAKIVGGKVAPQGSWPWMVLLKISQKDSLMDGNCGGSLISERHILTAAHCVKGAPAENVRVYPGSVCVEINNSSGYEAENVFVHENFDKKDYLEHDIALIKLKEKIIFDDDRRPICLPPPNINLDGKIAYIAGWGKTADNGATSNALLEGISFILSNAQCKKVLSSKLGINYLISDQQMCMGGDGKVDTCQGDSGGPIMYQTASDQWIVVGIVSYGFDCAREGFPGIQTRASTYLDWINAKLIL